MRFFPLCTLAFLVFVTSCVLICFLKFDRLFTGYIDLNLFHIWNKMTAVQNLVYLTAQEQGLDKTFFYASER